MKKLLIFLSLLISTVYLSNAIDMGLSGGEKLDSSTWNNVSSILNKVNINSSNLEINGKLNISGKLCDLNGKCLGDIEYGSESTPGTSCLDIKNNGITADGVYWIKPSGYTGSAFETLCDMTTDGGGRTIISNIDDTQRAIGIRNGNLTNIPDLSTFGVIHSTTGSALYNGATALLFKSGNYKYSVTNSSTALSCLKGTTVSYKTLHNGTVSKLGTSTLGISNLNYLGCNISGYDGWRFGGNESSSRESKQAFNNYYSGAAIIVNGTRNSSHVFTVWVR